MGAGNHSLLISLFFSDNRSLAIFNCSVPSVIWRRSALPPSARALAPALGIAAARAALVAAGAAAAAALAAHVAAAAAAGRRGEVLGRLRGLRIRIEHGLV